MPSTPPTNSEVELAKARWVGSTAIGRLAAWREYAFSYVCAATLILGSFLLLRFALVRFGEYGFEQLLIVRRFAAAAIPMFSLSLSVTMPKLVPRLKGNDKSKSNVRMLAAGLQLSLLTIGLYFAIAAIVPDVLCEMLTGSDHGRSLLLSLGVYLLGVVWTICNAGYARGKLWNNLSGVIHALNLAVLPLVVLPFADSVASFLLWTGSLQIASNQLIAMFVMRSHRRLLFSPQREALRSLAVMGLPRLPGEVSYYALLALPAILVAQFVDLSSGAAIAYGLVMLTLLMQLAAPWNSFSLAETVYLTESKDFRNLYLRLRRALGFVSGGTLLAVVALFILAPQLIAFHLGSLPEGYVQSVRWIIPAAIPLNVFLSLRGVVDAIYRRALVPHLSAATLVAFLGLAYLLSPALGTELAVAVGFLVACTLLSSAICMLVVVWLRRQLRENEQATIGSDVVRTAA